MIDINNNICLHEGAVSCIQEYFGMSCYVAKLRQKIWHNKIYPHCKVCSIVMIISLRMEFYALEVSLFLGLIIWVYGIFNIEIHSTYIVGLKLCFRNTH